MAEVAGLASFSFGEDEESRYVILFKKVSMHCTISSHKDLCKCVSLCLVFCIMKRFNSFVIFIYIALYIIQIVSKQLDSNK